MRIVWGWLECAQADAEAEEARVTVQHLSGQADGLRTALQSAHDRHAQQLQRFPLPASPHRCQRYNIDGHTTSE